MGNGLRTMRQAILTVLDRNAMITFTVCPTVLAVCQVVHALTLCQLELTKIQATFSIFARQCLVVFLKLENFAKIENVTALVVCQKVVVSTLPQLNVNDVVGSISWMTCVRMIHVWRVLVALTAVVVTTSRRNFARVSKKRVHRGLVLGVVVILEPYMNCDTPTIPGVSCTAYFLVTNDLEDCPQETISVVQIANPFSRDVDLSAYSVEFFGQEIKLNELNLPNGGMLEPSTYEKPATLILYSIPQPPDGKIPNVDLSTIVHSPANPEDEHIFDRDWLDFLDIQELKVGENIHPENTLVIRVPNVPIGEFSDGWSTSRTVYDGKLEGKQNSVAIYRFDEFHDDYLNEDVKQRVLVDRLETIDSNAPASRRFETRVVEEMQTQFGMLDMDDHPDDHEDQKRSGYITLTDSDGEKIPVFDKNGVKTAALFVQWDRATRAWAVDMPQVGDWHNDEIDSWEENPRFVFAAHDFIRSDEKRWVTNFDNKVIWGDQFEEMEHTTAFHWSEYEDPDDEDGDGNLDDVDFDPDGKPNDPDADLLPDFPDPMVYRKRLVTKSRRFSTNFF